MSLFDVHKRGHRELFGIEFEIFDNSVGIFNQYVFQQEDFYFCANFEYINKINLNPRYEILLLRSSAYIFVYIYDTKTDEFLAYDYSSYLYMKESATKGCKIDTIKFVSQDVMDKNSSFKSTSKYIDAVYVPSGLAFMNGSSYTKLRGNRNYFLNHIDQSKLVFRKYKTTDKSAVISLYEWWKQMSKENGNTFIVDARVFKDGLNNEYLHKHVLIYDGKLIGFISYLLCKDYCFIYSMKSTRDYPNSNIYMVNQTWKYIFENYEDIKYINLGGIDDVESTEFDYKMLLKPDYFLTYYSNVKVGE